MRTKLADPAGFGALLDALSKPEAYPHPAAPVATIQTHISAVFLAGPFAYKVRKPVDFGFLDFTSLENRLHDCEEEVRLNRRLAPDVYLGVEPVAAAFGGLKMGGQGEIVDYAVKMRRLPEDRTLESAVARGEADAATMGALARRLAEFHRAAERGERAARWARWGEVAANCRANFDAIEPFVGGAIDGGVYATLLRETEDALARLQPLIASRAAGGVACDTHGDLHLEHVYWFPGEPAPGDFVIVDCIEFSERFRYADPVADLAFLCMDLKFHGRTDLARALAEAYLEDSGDPGAEALLPFYSAYRADVRAKVECLELGEQEIPEEERERALGRARAHLLLALGELAPSAERPCLVMVAGLPGSGKTSLATRLAASKRLERICSDLVRKELAGVDADVSASAPIAQGIYSPDWSDRVYGEMLGRARAALLAGKRVVVEAGLRSEARRAPFAALARACAVPCVVLVCEAGEGAIRARLGAAREGGSDADWGVREALAAAWEPAESSPACRVRVVSTEGTREESLAQAASALAAEGLA